MQTYTGAIVETGVGQREGTNEDLLLWDRQKGVGGPPRQRGIGE